MTRPDFPSNPFWNPSVYSSSLDVDGSQFDAPFTAIVMLQLLHQPILDSLCATPAECEGEPNTCSCNTKD